MELVRTKLDAPFAGNRLLQRPRLAERFDEARARRVTLVHAPAGYGKTSLLSQWHETAALTSFPVWLSVDASDQSAAPLLAYLRVGLLDSSSRERRQDVDNLVATELFGTAEPLLASITAAIERIGRPVLFFIDDAHLLGAHAANALFRLIERVPDAAHFILASRATPDLHIARLRANGELLELGADELRFTVEESDSFMAQCGGLQLDAQQLAQLDERTEGWIAGTKLVSLALRGGKPSMELLASFHGSRRSVSDFFAEEVLAQQPPEMRDFLLKTSILDRLCPSLCNAVVAQSNSRRLLNQIEESGLFVVQLDEERVWSRYHHLFQEFLQRRLEEEDQGMVRALYQRASEWFSSNGYHAEAIEHALRGDNPERAAALLEQRCHDLSSTGKFRLVGEFLSRIPETILHRYPRVLLANTWLLSRNLRFSEARQLLDIVRAHLAQAEAAGEMSPTDRQQLHYLVQHREMVLSSAEDDAPRVERQCQKLLEEHSEHPNDYLRAMVCTQLLYARREQYQLADMERLQSIVQRIIERTEYSFAYIPLQSGLAPSLFFAGKTGDAVRTLEQALAHAVRMGGPRSALSALPALPLSEIIYEQNDLERAELLLGDHLEYVTEFGFVDQIMPGYLTQARLRRARGDLDGAFLWLDKAMSIAVERRLDRLRHAVIAERIKLLIHSGQPDRAARYAIESGYAGPIEDILPRGEITSIHEMRALSWVRVALAEDRSADARACIKHWRSFCATRGAVRSGVTWDILLAHAHFIEGEQRAAQRALGEAIAHAAPSRLIRSFVDESVAIRSLLFSAYEAELEVLHPSDAFASELMDAFDHPSRRMAVPVRAAGSPHADEGIYGKLSAKEREILALVSSGLRNREIARKLGMTEGSVKWYMQQVYDKVGTRRRLQAVERARRFGLIA